MVRRLLGSSIAYCAASLLAWGCSSSGGAQSSGGEGDSGASSDAPTDSGSTTESGSDAPTLHDGGADVDAPDGPAMDAPPDAPPANPCAAHGGTTYYVSPTGDDGAAGTLAAPFKTVGHGLGVLSAGDTLCIRAGTYAEANQFGTSGTQTSPIVISGYPGERPVIDVGGAASSNAFALWNDAMEIGWIQLQGLEIRGATFGVHFSNVHHFTIEDDWVHDNGGQGILGTGHDIFINRNRVYANGITATPTNLNHGLYVTGRRYAITNNLVYGNEAFGLQIAAYGCGTDCFGADYAGAVDWTVANNVFAYEKNRTGIVVWLPGTSYGTETGTDIGNITIANNVFYENNVLNPGGTVGVDVDDEYSSGSDPSGADWPSITVENDLFYGTSGGPSVASTPAVTVKNLVEGKDPLFVAPMSFDFHLQSGSPAVGAGLNLTSLGNAALNADFDGKPRPASGAWDVGAYVHP
ncbi:MAG TPA: choice-of-anchor Q domain-containing protein [Polyangiaceae bacterium]